MQYIPFAHPTLVALSAYLRHLDLSLDRSRWGAWQDYVAYAQTQVEPAVIAHFLQAKYPAVAQVPATERLPDHLSSKQRLFHLVGTITQRNNSLTCVEVAYLWRALETYRVYLEKAPSTYSIALEKLRLQLAHFCYRILEPKLSPRERRHTMRIEHYLSAHHLETLPLHPFVACLQERAS
ncbi:hypothetical protein BXP70_28660 [Hymenobacter crusticola]|uniref:Uncharacterized protein n=1 Tax=Hymenobacter crusticola TaxID=1770526 RepID=A0A243W6J3_9BACT|nr:hypothetical protein BXP70_28660 [Hymenobacter crusticola]